MIGQQVYCYWRGPKFSMLAAHGPHEGAYHPRPECNAFGGAPRSPGSAEGRLLVALRLCKCSIWRCSSVCSSTSCRDGRVMETAVHSSADGAAAG